MDGYTIKEAASVLGVPKGRVWELVARGILAGTPVDGGGMRVYLQGRPSEPILSTPQRRPAEPDDRPRSANGNGGEHGQPGFEASPFRELLTEFRNLTERYGQALLALGEARGEVASLRTRVEILEARVDLRLPSSAPFVQWSPPTGAPANEQAEPSPGVDTEPAAEPAEPVADAPAFSAEEGPAAELEEPPSAPVEMAAQAAAATPARKQRQRRRRQDPRSATEVFAEALVRAQDPTPAELPGGDEAQAALDDLRERIRRESADELLEPGESPAAALPEAFEHAAQPAADLVGDEGMTQELDAAEAFEAIGFAEAAAPAEAVELDSFLADDELGGTFEEPVAEEPLIEEALIEEALAAEALAAEPEVDRAIEGEAVAAAGEIESPSQPLESSMTSKESEPVVATRDEEIGSLDGAPIEAASQPIEAASQREAPAPAYSSEWDEPDWIAEEDVDWGAGDVQQTQEPVAMGETPEIGWDELPEATAAPPPAEAPEAPEVEPTSAVTEPSESAGSQETLMPRAIPIDPREPASDDGGMAPEASSAPADAARGASSGATAAPEEELMWLGDEFETSSPTWGASGRATTAVRPNAVETGVSAAEDEALSRLAVERGWDDAELQAIRSLLAQPGRAVLDVVEAAPSEAAEPVPSRDVRQDEAAEETRAPEVREEEAFNWERGPSAWTPPALARPSQELPGGVELDRAMAAFEVSAWSKETPERATDEVAITQPTEPSAPEPVQAEMQPPIAAEPQEPQRADEDWLRGRRGPAANAYRRLRRLFP
jgi:excisionase family DNA binding protein